MHQFIFKPEYFVRKIMLPFLILSLFVLGCFAEGILSYLIVPDKCKLDVSVGKCRAIIPKFYYDKDMKSCQPFSYGGCGGNDNRFGSLEECINECVVPYNIKNTS